MTWPRRHELIDLDLDAYADDGTVDRPVEAEPAKSSREPVVEQKRVSVLNAAERAGIPLEELLPKLDP